MMNNPYFVMLIHPNGKYLLPLVDDNNEMMQFHTKKEAHDAAKSSSLGSECGAKTQAEALDKCICGGDKDDCHGCHIWPDD